MKQYRTQSGAYHLGYQCKKCLKAAGQRVWWTHGYDETYKICPECGTVNSMKKVVVRYHQRQVKHWLWGWQNIGDSTVQVLP